MGGGQRRNRSEQDRFKISELFADEMQQGDPRLPGNNGSWTDSGPTGGGRGSGSEASEWEMREREEYLAQIAEEERALGEGAED